MSSVVLIVEPNEVVRAGLCTIFAEDPRVSNVYEVTHEQDLQSKLSHNKSALVVVNQTLVRDVSTLKTKNLVILATKLDIQLLKAAYKHGARGYLSVSVSAELLRATLQLTENTFLIEPAFVPSIMDHISDNVDLPLQEGRLTPREREIVSLLRDGRDKFSIAKKLGISDLTLKTHIKNIEKKRTKRATYQG